MAPQFHCFGVAVLFVVHQGNHVSAKTKKIAP